jgi:2'-5' RNA ligase
MPESEPSQVRLFVALSLDRATVDALVAWRVGAVAGLPGWRPVAADGLHVTLCFLGSVSAGSVDAIGDAVLGATAGPVRADVGAAGLTLGRALLLPPRRPRVLAVELIDPSGACGRLQAAVSGALAAGGWYEPETRPWLAHSTVARAPRDGRNAGVPAVPVLGASGALGAVGALGVVRCSAVTLYRSRLGAGGARYEALRTVAIPSA